MQNWIAERRGVRFIIMKPVFDVGPPLGAGAAARSACIPDFILRAEAGGCEQPVLLVDTMGYRDDEHRSRNERIHPMMCWACGDVPLVMHPFQGPASERQETRDDRFWKAVRWGVSGPQDWQPRECEQVVRVVSAQDVQDRGASRSRRIGPLVKDV